MGLSGCMRLKGPAKQVDLALLLMESTRITRKISILSQMVADQFEISRAGTQQLRRALRHMPGTNSTLNSGWQRGLPLHHHKVASGATWTTASASSSIGAEPSAC